MYLRTRPYATTARQRRAETGRPAALNAEVLQDPRPCEVVTRIFRMLWRSILKVQAIGLRLGGETTARCYPLRGGIQVHWNRPSGAGTAVQVKPESVVVGRNR